MVDANASGAGAGEGAAAGTGAASAAAGTGAAGTAVAGAASGAGAAGSAAGGQAAHFYDTIGDADLKTWVGGKNWNDLAAMATSHRNLEKLIGAPADEIVRLGKNPEASVVRDLQTRLGMPADPAKYEISMPDNMPVDQPFVDWARQAFHKAGFTNTQAKEFSKAYNDFAAARVEQANKDYELNIKADEGALRTEWGNGYDAQMNRAKVTVKALGIPSEAVDAMESAMGYAGVMKFFASLSSKFSEDTFRDAQSGGRNNGFGINITPSEAKAELNRLLADTTFKAALTDRNHPQHNDAIARKSQLVALIG